MRMHIATLALAALGLAACASKPVDAGTAPDVDPRRNITNTVSYGCIDGSVFTIAYLVGNLGAEIHYPDGAVKTLKPALSASGAKYEGEGYTFWGKGDEGTYTAPGKTETLCRVAK